MLNQHGVKDKIVLAMDTDEDTLQWIQKGRDRGDNLTKALHNELCRA